MVKPAKCTDLASHSDELHRQGGLDFADRPLLECRGRRRGLLGLLQERHKGTWTWLKTLAPGQTSLAVTVSPGVTYQFEVGAYRTSGYTFCNPISRQSGLVARPAAPTNIAVSAISADKAQLHLDCRVRRDHSYEIYYYNGTAWQGFATTSNTYIDILVTPGKTYSFDVAAINSAGTGPLGAYRTIPMPL